MAPGLTSSDQAMGYQWSGWLSVRRRSTDRANGMGRAISTVMFNLSVLRDVSDGPPDRDKATTLCVRPGLSASTSRWAFRCRTDFHLLGYLYHPLRRDSLTAACSNLLGALILPQSTLASRLGGGFHSAAE